MAIHRSSGGAGALVPSQASVNSLGAASTSKRGSITRRNSLRPQWEDRKTTSSHSPGDACAPPLPEPFNGAAKIQALGAQELKDKETLHRWLGEQGLETEHWGEGNTKDVGSLWKEIHLDECGLELWKKADGNRQVVRVVHVLRGKVCTAQGFQRGIFLFNTWQQYGDGRQRTRNGLLSEKVGMSEMPLKDNFHEICCRAVAEELHQVADASYRVPPGEQVFEEPAPLTVKVEDEHFVDHTIEVEISKSFPGLLTMYHLYTAEIVCSGLPSVDFNTLEFKPPDAEGRRPLKYVHAWTWLPWQDIQRYLLEGSTLKERKSSGSFEDALGLARWLSQFDIDLESWEGETARSFEDLFYEIEHGKTQLELWGRHDGVPLVMRVVHVLQLEVTSSDADLAGKVLLQTWCQRAGSEAKAELRLPFRSLSLLGEHLPFDEAAFGKAAEQLVKEQLTRVVDPHFRMQRGVEPVATESDVQVERTSLGEARHHIDSSVDYPGLCTLYHMYGVEVECTGLPATNFASVDRPLDDTGAAYLSRHASQLAHGFKWLSWPEYAHLLQAQVSDSRIHQVRIHRICEAQEDTVGSGERALGEMSDVLHRIAARTPVEDQDPDVAEALRLLGDMQDALRQTTDLKEAVFDEAERIKDIPPSMLSQMKENLIANQESLRRANLRRQDTVREIAHVLALSRSGALHLPEGTPTSAQQSRPRQASGQCSTTTPLSSESFDDGTSLPPPPPPPGAGGEEGDSVDRARLLEALRNMGRRCAAPTATIASATPQKSAEDYGGRQLIPLSTLMSILSALRPDLPTDDMRSACNDLARGRETVDCDEFVDWLYDD